MARQAGSSNPPAAEYWCVSISEAPLSERTAASITSVFTVLSDPVRLRLLSLVASQGEVCSCDLEEPLGRTQPTISHHTRVLTAAGLLTSERRGRSTFWKVPDECLAGIQALLSATQVCAEAMDDLAGVARAGHKAG